MCALLLLKLLGCGSFCLSIDQGQWDEKSDHAHLGMRLTGGVVLSLLLLQGIASIRRLFTVITCKVLMSGYDDMVTMEN